MAATMQNPAMVAMMGNVYGTESLTQASVMAQECLLWFMIAAAIMNIFLVNRHTRTDEEKGRLEMIRALPVGKLTGSLAIIKFAFAVNVLISITSAALLLLLGIGGTTLVGALVYGFAIGAVGFVFAGISLLGAQLFSTANGVNGFGFALLGLSYVIRAVGDVSGSMLSNASPFGLGLKAEAFYSNSICPLLILFFEGVVLSVIALAVCAFRDHGSGVIPAKKGRAGASIFLRSPFGLALRLSRASALGWGAGMLLLGASYGSVCTQIDSFVAGNEMVMKVLASNGAFSILDNYVSMILLISSILAAVPVVLTSIKIHGEERCGRLEQILVRAVPRTKLYCGFLLVAVIESFIMQLLFSAGLALASGGALNLAEIIKADLSYLPAIWVLMGLAVLLVGILPKLTPLVWLALGYSFIIMYLGRILDTPKWMENVSPFGSIAEQPVQAFEPVPLAVLSLIAAALTAVGLWRFKSRDIG
jgi:ABC-2 type transport system permease protein